MCDRLGRRSACSRFEIQVPCVECGASPIALALLCTLGPSSFVSSTRKPKVVGWNTALSELRTCGAPFPEHCDADDYAYKDESMTQALDPYGRSPFRLRPHRTMYLCASSLETNSDAPPPHKGGGAPVGRDLPRLALTCNQKESPGPTEAHLGVSRSCRRGAPKMHFLFVLSRGGGVCARVRLREAGRTAASARRSVVCSQL